MVQSCIFSFESQLRSTPVVVRLTPTQVSSSLYEFPIRTNLRKISSGVWAWISIVWSGGGAFPKFKTRDTEIQFLFLLSSDVLNVQKVHPAESICICRKEISNSLSHFFKQFSGREMKNSIMMELMLITYPTSTLLSLPLSSHMCKTFTLQTLSASRNCIECALCYWGYEC